MPVHIIKIDHIPLVSHSVMLRTLPSLWRVARGISSRAENGKSHTSSSGVPRIHHRKSSSPALEISSRYRL